MLIFDKGLHIIFVDEKLDHKTGVIKSIIPFEKGNRYVVDAYEHGTITKCSSISENQILQVYIKDVFGYDIWAKINDLYPSYPNGTIIRPDTILKRNIDVSMPGRNSGRYLFIAVVHIKQKRRISQC